MTKTASILIGLVLIGASVSKVKADPPIEYIALEYQDHDYLAYTVQYLSQQGWKLQGGVSIAINPANGYPWFVQAMWRPAQTCATGCPPKPSPTPKEAP